VGAVDENAFFGVAREGTIDKFGDEKDVSVIRGCHALRLVVRLHVQ
jgi:hypothetical protein